MKRGITILCIMACCIAAQAQMPDSLWAPVGAEWVYSVEAFDSYNEWYLSIKVAKDTVVDGQVCKQLLSRQQPLFNQDTSWYIEGYIFQQNGVVYRYYNELGGFKPLYDWNLQVGDTFKAYSFTSYLFYPDDSIVQVVIDSVDTISINGFARRRYIYRNCCGSSNYEFSGAVYEGIGWDHFLFPIFGAVDPAPEPLRCYHDSVLGSFKNPEYNRNNCYYTYVSSPTLEADVDLRVINPVNDQLYISTTQPLGQTQVQIVDVTGRVLYTDIRPISGSCSIDVSQLPVGTYILRLQTASGTAVKRFLKL